MISMLKNRLSCTALLLSSLQFGFAQSQTNDATLTFGPPLTPVWEISGYYQITNRLQGVKFRPLDIVFKDLGLGVDAHGKILGAGTTVVPVGDDYVGGDYKVTGNISGGGAKTRVKFTVKFKGNGTVAGIVTTCNMTVKYDLQVNPLGLTMVGKTTGNANFSNLGGGKFNSDISLPLPPGVNGGWTVVPDLLVFGNKISGTAVIFVNTWTNGSTTTLATKAKGNVSKSLVQKVKLSGSGSSAGTQITLEFAPTPATTNQLATAKGKVLGQKVDY